MPKDHPLAVFSHCLGDSSGRRGLDRSLLGSSESIIAVDLGCGAFARDVACLTAAVAGLASGAKRTAIGSSAVARDVAELATSVALHGLRLAVARKVVGAAALVASRRTTAAEAAAESTKTAARDTGTHSSGVGARASKVTGLSARVAAAAGAGAAQAQSRAVSLDMAKALAVVALLSLGGARVGAGVGLVARLLAVVAKALSGGANLSIVADIATLVASATREGRHCNK